MKTYNFILKAILFFITAVIILTSCNRSNDPLEDKSPGTVTFKISEVVFESEDQLGARSATPHHAGDVSYASVQRNAVEFGDDLLMVAELSADDSPNLSPATKASLKDASRTALDTSNLGVGIRYRVVVYNTTTQLYVTERDYTRGSEPAIGDLQLDGGTRYTFVVYSVNSTSTTLPAISPAIGRTLTNSTIVVNGNQDYMYFQQELTVNGNATNNLNIVLKHRFSQITTVINSIATGYNITSVTSNFKPHAATTIATLSTGNFTGTVSAAGSPVTFTTPNAQTVTSVPTIIANTSGGTVGSYTITSMKIGDLTQSTTMIPFPNLVIQPGVRYTLRLTITTNDADLGTYNGQPAVRINGVVWAKQNLGATSTNPAVVTQSSFGNYYQYGSSTIVGTATTTTLNNSSYITWTAEPAAKAWNSGTEALPVKTAADPCPTGYRVPTQTEFNSLIDGVRQTPFGTFATSTSYNNYVQLTSLRRSGVVLNFPAIGFLSVTYTPGAVSYNRSTRTDPVTPRYHTSSSESRGDTPYSYLTIDNTTNKNLIVFTNEANRSSKYLGGNIRCVGI